MNESRVNNSGDFVDACGSCGIFLLYSSMWKVKHAKGNLVFEGPRTRKCFNATMQRSKDETVFRTLSGSQTTVTCGSLHDAVLVTRLSHFVLGYYETLRFITRRRLGYQTLTLCPWLLRDPNILVSRRNPCIGGHFDLPNPWIVRSVEGNSYQRG